MTTLNNGINNTRFNIIVYALLIIVSILFTLMANFSEPIMEVGLILNVLMIVFVLTFFLSTVKSYSYINPFTLFVFSCFIFILVRPIIFFYDVDANGSEIITAGYPLSKNILNNTYSYILIVLSLIFIFLNIFQGVTLKLLINLPEINFNSNILSILFLFPALILSFVFLYKSYLSFILLGTIGIFNAESYGLNENNYLFFFAKYFYLLSLLFSKKKYFLFYSSLIFLTSIGFFLIGQRGYTIAYFFAFLMFLNMKYRLKLGYLLFLSLIVTFFSSVMLNYRLGFSVNASNFDMFFLPFIQQGASFETVYGMVGYADYVRDCIPYFDYFFTNKDIGVCIDHARGVYFDGGSFASSFFAELFYLGPFLGVLVVAVFSFSISLIYSCYIVAKGKILNSNFTPNLLIMFLIPNLVYFARSSAFDLISKILLSFFLIVILSFFSKMLFFRNRG